MLSDIRQLDLKALCDSETSFGIHFFRRFAIVLDIILYKTLHRLIGRKSVGFSGDLSFGMRVRKV